MPGINELRRHVSAGKGVSNTLLWRLGKLACGRDFHGVYPANKIPRSLARRGRFVVIVNLGERQPGVAKLPVGHFVCVAGEVGKVNYVDPYGLPCIQPKVVQFLSDCQRKVWENKKQIQHFDSAYCALYSLLFAVYFDKKFSNALPAKRFCLRFYRDRLKSNDRKCVEYLQRLINA